MWFAGSIIAIPTILIASVRLLRLRWWKVLLAMSLIPVVVLLFIVVTTSRDIINAKKLREESVKTNLNSGGSSIHYRYYDLTND
jgi:ABC-type bacteriocin/lantibiotic exporter with double-glycine peptidase domain